MTVKNIRLTCYNIADNLVSHDTRLQPLKNAINSQPILDDWHLPNQLASEADPDQQTDTALAEPKTRRPPMYAVVLFNDDYTPMEFVIYLLKAHFKHSHEAAYNIMMTVHLKGKGAAGIFPREIAESKAAMVNHEARIEGYPLLCQIEPLGGN